MRRGIAALALVASLAPAATAGGAGGAGGSGGDRAAGPVTLTWWDTSNATDEAPTYRAQRGRLAAVQVRHPGRPDGRQLHRRTPGRQLDPQPVRRDPPALRHHRPGRTDPGDPGLLPGLRTAAA